MYQSSDENFQEFLDDPSLIVNFAMARGISSDAEVIIEQETPDAGTITPKQEEEAPEPGQPFKPSKLRLNTNYHVILYDKDGNITRNHSVTLIITEDCCNGLLDDFIQMFRIQFNGG